MDISSFSENIVTEYFERNGERVELKINIDAFVPEYFDALDVRMNEIEKRHASKIAALTPDKKKNAKPPSVLKTEKTLLEIQREAYAEMLTCPIKLPDGSTTQLLKDWDLTENGMPLMVSKEVLIKLPPRAVEDLWNFCKDKSKTVKKRVDGETEEVSESTPSGSRALRAVGQVS
jgi:hypothetical protein